VIAGVKPIDSTGGGRRLEAAAPEPGSRKPIASTPDQVPARPQVQPARPARSDASGNTLDGSWDRRLARGLAAPESSVDLHGHTLATAYDRLDHALESAISRGDRLLLLVTGKPPGPQSQRPHQRGAIRAAVGDWLAASRHADRIAAVRPAHQRHGGSGALYIVLRRPRTAAPRKS